ncbi:YqgE/AlgH family protein [Prescottella subtropica]|uniref:YqgE/AlgH family protein n=1 Tax=Prescottella subtropica TaxID=2545757 RepID=UPI0010F537D3|nr:YqgE/AlgH family protein [Prescottella subtropica]
MAHSEDPEDRTASTHPVVRPGSLLVASTELFEPTFRRSVVYVLEHNDAGSLGVVVGQISETSVQEILPQWADLASDPKAIHVGGPVTRDAALCLATLKVGADITGIAGLRRVDGRVVIVDLDADPATIAPVVDGLRIFAGYAGWTLGQLDAEIENDDWIVVSALASDIVSPPRTDVWGRVLRRQPLPLALLATHPIDVDLN